jgi:CHAT domain-containing protein
LFRQAVRDEPADGEAWYRLGEALVRSAEYDEGRRALSEGLGLARATNDQVLELATLVLTGESYLRQGRAVEAEPFFAQALPMARQSGDWTRQVAALHGFGTVFHVLGEIERSRQYLERALECARATINRGAEARLLDHLGEIHIRLGEYGPARQYLDEAVTLARTIGDLLTERIGLNDLSVIATRQGAYREARATLEKALHIARIIGDRRGEALILSNIGDVEALRGAYQAAFPILEEALSAARMAGATAIEVETLQTIGSANFALGAYPEAQAAYEKGLALARTHRVPLFEGLMLHSLGQVSLARKVLDEAKQYEEAALAISHRAASRRVELLALHGLAEVQLARGDFNASRDLFERVMDLARQLSHAETLWGARYGLGRILDAQGDPHAALLHYREAVTVITTLARQFGEEADRQSFLANKLTVYDALTRLLLKLHEQDASQGYDREAWAILEAKKGRIAGEALTAARPKLQDPQARGAAGAVQAKQEQVLALEKVLRTEQGRPPGAQRPERIQSLTTQVARTKAEYLAQVKAFLGRYPQYKAQFVDQHTVDPRTLAKFAEELPPHTLAVQYFAAPDQLYCFVVAPGGKFQVKVQAVAQAELYGLIRQYRKYIERGATRPLGWAEEHSEEYRRDVVPLKEVTRTLAAHLLGPIEAELQTHSHLILLPNDQVLYLPIHALTRRQPDGSERFLAETHAVSYLTQQELVSLFKAAPPSATAPLLALANPDGSLPAASREVRELRRIRPTVTALDGAEATKERFLALAGQFPDLHLATHGILDKERSERSYLLMAGADEESQRLGIDEIAGLSLKNGMAILSACDTAVGEQVPGAALITLAAAFSQAGAHTIVASLWQVNDASTRDFMVAFYKALPTHGRAAALQQAQLTVLRNPSTANPHYWAPFILIGAR